MSASADKVSGVFVPVVITLAIITTVVWLLVGKDVGFSLILHTPCNIIREEERLLLFYRDRHILTIEGTLEIEVRDGVRSVYYLSAESISQICFKGRLKSGKAESLIRLDVIMNEEELA